LPWQSPVSDYRFLLDHIVSFDAVAASERYAHATPDTVSQILTEAARMCDGVLAPLERAGEVTPCKLENGVVRTPKGYAEGFRAIAEGGWIGMCASPQFGGMGLPLTLGTVVNEMMGGACLSLQLNPLMSEGQIEALEHHASDEIKALYLPKLISGEWTATMNLTEPQAGSDVGALRTTAKELADGTFEITGTKIFITWADHDFGGNVCHLVLARLPDGAPGTKGISLFMVPKFLPTADGGLGERNGVKVVSIEHKMGIHGSPTAVMDYDRAKGWLIGERHGGMKAMFTMMNNARLGVATQGVSQAEVACQKATVYALDRKQGRPPVGETIAGHADVRRMLLTMRAEVFAARAIMLSCAVAGDLARAGQAGAAERAAFLTPITKTWSTETGMRVSEMAMQVFGGMGYIEETGIAQHSRDVRITAIYEGTNGIQAMDLVGRKLADGGDVAHELIEEVQTCAEQTRASEPELARRVWDAAEALREATDWMLAAEMIDRQAGAVPYLSAFARVLGAAAHLKSAKADATRRTLADFYIHRLLPEVGALLAHARAGSAGLYAVKAEDLLAG
jgi:acyl-CoA dehydrogenase